MAVIGAISRWSVRLDGALRLRLYARYPGFHDTVAAAERTGWIAPVGPGSFTAYTHRPSQLKREVATAGLHVREVLGVEGAAGLVADIDARMDDAGERQVLLDAARAMERVPELLGASPHLIALAERATGPATT